MNIFLPLLCDIIEPKYITLIPVFIKNLTTKVCLYNVVFTDPVIYCYEKTNQQKCLSRNLV